MQHTKIALQYTEDVISGKIPACVHVKRACERFHRDLERSETDWPFFYDADEAERWCRFLSKLPHVKGVWARNKQRFDLQPWQVFIVCQIFGWRNKETGLRRFRDIFIECPRKSGKSYLIAAIGVGMLCIDGEQAAEVYCGATSEQQAWYVFGQARLICKNLPALRKRFGLEVNAKSLVIQDKASSFRTVIGKPGDGASPSCAIADEYHEHKDSDQVDTFVTGMGARDQPLMLQITTAGSDLGGPCYNKRADVIDVLSGAVEDDTVFGIIYSVDEADPWDTVEAQIKANPNYGVSVSAEFLQGQLDQARRSATKQTAYKTKHLNLWVGAKAAWMNMLAYQACRRKNLDLESFTGRKAYLGLDLASKRDLCSLAVVIPPEGHPDNDVDPWHVFFRNYVPEERITEGGSTRYKAWHAEGWLTATDGNVTDYNVIKEDIRDLMERLDIGECGFDPWQATQLSGELLEEGVPMVQVNNTVPNFSEPMKTVEALIVSKRMLFQFDPLAMWCFGNVVARLDKKDNVYPTKERDEAKIDPVVALITAMNRALAAESEGTIYDEREPTFA